MKRSSKKNDDLKLPAIVPGNWRGEIVGSGSVNFGQIVQPGPPQQAVEFTYLILPVQLTMPDGRFVWPGVLMLMTQTPMKSVSPDAGLLLKVTRLPSLTLLLEVGRMQFSDMLRFIEARRLREFHFTIEGERDTSWAIQSWGISQALA